MTRPAGPFPVWATDETYAHPGKSWDGEANRVAPSAGETAQGFEPTQRLPAEELNSILHTRDRWIAYLDGIEAKNWPEPALEIGPHKPYVGDLYGIRPVAWNPIRAAYIAVTVVDHVTTLRLSTDGGQTWSDVATGLASSTASTIVVAVTSSAGVSGVAAHNYFVRDPAIPEHVWTNTSTVTMLAGTHNITLTACTVSGTWPSVTYVADLLGPVDSAAGTLTEFTSSGGSDTTTATTNAAGATLGTDPLGGFEGSIQVDPDGGAIANPSGQPVYWTGPNAIIPDHFSFPTVAAGNSFYYDICYFNDGATGFTPGHYLFAGKDASGHPSLYVALASNVEFATTTAQTLPNASSHTTDYARCALSGSGVVFISVESGVNQLWTGEIDGTYTDQGDPGFSGACVSVIWSDKDLLFLVVTDSGFGYTSTDGITWNEMFGNPIADSFQYFALLGGTWLAVATINGVQRYLVQLNQGTTAWVQVPFFGGAAPTLNGLVTLDSRFAMAITKNDGSMYLRKSLRV